MVCFEYNFNFYILSLSAPRWRVVELEEWATCSESMAAPPPLTSRASLSRASLICSVSSTRRGPISAARPPYTSGNYCAPRAPHRARPFLLLSHVVTQVEMTGGQERRMEPRGWGRKAEGRSHRWARPLCSGNWEALVALNLMEEKERLMMGQGGIVQMHINRGCAPKALSTLMLRASCLTSMRQPRSGDTQHRGGTLPPGLQLPQCP